VTELLFSTAFTLWGLDTSWLELIAVLLAFAMIVCNIIELHWGWPLAAISSVLYFFLFWSQSLYGEALLQVLFIVLAMWGWSVWLRGIEGAPLLVTRMPARQRLTLAWMGCLLWLGTGAVLLNFTDTDVPWWDAFPTAFSLVGQYLLAQKRLENWAVWIIVNIVATGLFAWKGLWLTTLLYLAFIALSAVGWRTWAKHAQVEAA
jgi:nicotinamide mononucleotide transporter